MLDEIWKECRDLICCDAEGCVRRGPTKRCGRCQLTHYCSRECQVSDWKSHKHLCVPIKDMRNDQEGCETCDEESFEIGLDEDTVQRLLAQEGIACGLCLEPGKKIENPVVLKGCHHAFCFSCLIKWNDMQTDPDQKQVYDLDPEDFEQQQHESPTCPICRQEMPNLSEMTIQKAYHFLKKANLKDKTTSGDCTELCAQALKTVNLLMGGENPTIRQKCAIAVVSGQVPILMKEYEKAISVFADAAVIIEEAVGRTSEYNELAQRLEVMCSIPGQEEECARIFQKVKALRIEGCATRSEHAAVLLRLAEARRLAKDWEGARATYYDIAVLGTLPDIEGGDSSPLYDMRELQEGMSECAYNLGRNDIAILNGRGAIAINRYYPWCHKITALAFKAQGDLVQARRTAAEAVIYEKPWDAKHAQEVRQWYKNNFREAVVRPPTADNGSETDESKEEIRVSPSTDSSEESKDASTGGAGISKSSSDQLEPLFQKLLNVAERDPAQPSQITDALEKLIGECEQKAARESCTP